MENAALDWQGKRYHPHPIRLEMPEQYGAWLDPRCQDTEELTKLLRPYPPEGMLAYRVSTVVNNPNNDVAECVAAIPRGIRAAPRGLPRQGCGPATQRAPPHQREPLGRPARPPP